jgi:hypothetical protein
VKDRSVYSHLLHSRPLLSEHPRQAPEHIQAILRQKPFWSADKEVWDWAKKTGEGDGGDDDGGDDELLEGLVVNQAQADDGNSEEESSYESEDWED